MRGGCLSRLIVDDRPYVVDHIWLDADTSRDRYEYVHPLGTLLLKECVLLLGTAHEGFSPL